MQITDLDTKFLAPHPAPYVSVTNNQIVNTATGIMSGNESSGSEDSTSSAWNRMEENIQAGVNERMQLQQQIKSLQWKLNLLLQD